MGIRSRVSILLFAASTLPALALAAPTPAGIDLATGLRPFRDLPRYFDGSRLERAARWLRRGNCRRALREVSRALAAREVRESLRGPAAFLAGLCAHRTGEFARAASFLAEAAERYAAMRDHANFLLGDALLRAGEASRAVAVLEKVPPESPSFSEARVAWARALAASEAPAQVASALMKFVAASPLDPGGLPPLPPVGPPPSRQTGAAPKPPDPDGPGPAALARRAEIALLLARALEQARKLTHAVSQYLYVWARFPGTAFASRARERLADLRRKVGKAAVPDVYYRFLRARSLLAAGRFGSARFELAPLVQRIRRRAPTHDLRWQIELALGVALARSGDPVGAVRRLRSVSAKAPDPEVRAEAAYRTAAELARRRRIALALQEYREVARHHPESELAPRAIFDGAELARLYGRHAEARSLFEQLLARFPSWEHAARAAWRLGWYDLKAGDPAAAVEQFRAAALNGARGDRARALYWLGRAEERRGRAVEAAAAFRVLRRAYPLTYYAYLARGRLSEAGAHESREAEAALMGLLGEPGSHRPSEFADPRLRHAREYLRLGMAAEARAALKEYERGSGRTPGGMMAVAALYAELGAERRAHWVLRLRAPAFRRHPTDRRIRPYWHLAYPRRYVKEIEGAARRAGLPPALLFAIVREESSFDPRAISPQRAIGLTQVIWETAQDMARDAGIRLRSRADLFRPRVNAELGARFLARLVRNYRGRWILAAAAYNAGPGNVDRWLAERGLRRDGPVAEDELVEEIPFEETRRYVRKVLSSYVAYRYLYYGERVASLRASPAARLAALLR
jgi:soluble lytic murein transglycosylase